MGFFKKSLSLYGATWGIPVRPSTKKERATKQTHKLLREQNALLRQQVAQQAPAEVRRQAKERK